MPLVYKKLAGHARAKGRIALIFPAFLDSIDGPLGIRLSGERSQSAARSFENTFRSSSAVEQSPVEVLVHVIIIDYDRY
jgi:hypothetical protein